MLTVVEPLGMSYSVRMRITGGILRGRRLKVPRGGVRPTQDRVREALFSMLADRVPGARVLDLFAGSGAVGLEAWSRGAEAVCCVEGDRRTAATLRANAAMAEGEVRVVCCRVAGFLDKRLAGASFDIIFADPPYRWSAGARNVAGLLATLARVDAVAPGGVVVIETGSGAETAEYDGWMCLADRLYGESRLRIYTADSG